MAGFGIIPIELLVLGLSTALHILGWTVVGPELNNSVPDGTYLKAPGIFVETFGHQIAALFPPLVLSICTCLGILANLVYRYTQGNIKQLTKETFGPLLLSPLILYTTYAIAIDHPDGFIACLLAFQNGFFWQTLFEQHRRRIKQGEA